MEETGHLHSVGILSIFWQSPRIPALSVKLFLLICYKYNWFHVCFQRLGIDFSFRYVYSIGVCR